MANCSGCGRKLSKPRQEARKRACFLCEVASRRERKRKGHDWAVESEDFTASDYWDLFRAQDGRCAVFSCRAQGKARYLAVEHDHLCEMGHDPKKWCRACVRGLVCSMHNEWIGRAGDNPDVFDSLASFLRNPPAREVLMDKMIVGTDIETIGTLGRDYRIPPKRARRMLDLARGVGPSPTAVPNGTIIIRYVRIPRTTKELYEIIESAPRIDSRLALKRLMDEYRLSERKAKSLLNTAWERGKHKATTPAGIVRIEYHGRGAGKSYVYSLEGDS
jgi:hypothetical protein